MNYDEVRKKRKESQQNRDVGVHAGDLKNWPLLLSGLNSYLDAEGNRSVLSVQLYFRRGRATCRVLDRQDRTQFFLDLDSIENWADAVEAALASDLTDWIPDRAPGNGRRD